MCKLFLKVSLQVVGMGLLLSVICLWFVDNLFLFPVPIGAYQFALVMAGIMTVLYALITMLVEARTYGP